MENNRKLWKTIENRPRRAHAPGRACDGAVAPATGCQTHPLALPLPTLRVSRGRPVARQGGLCSETLPWRSRSLVIAWPICSRASDGAARPTPSRSPSHHVSRMADLSPARVCYVATP